MIRTYFPLFTEGQFSELTDPASAAYHPLFGPLAVMELCGNVMIALGAVGLLVLMFRRSRYFPRIAIFFFAATIVYNLLDIWLGSMIPWVAAQAEAGESIETGRSVVFGVIWSLYLLRSKRVRGTFVN